MMEKELEIFSLGGVFYELYTNIIIPAKRKSELLCTILGISILLGFYMFGIEKVVGNIDFTFAYFLCPMLLILSFNDLWKRICSNQIFLKLGEISSYIFFWHIPLLLIIQKFLKGNQYYTGLANEYKFLLYIGTLIMFCVFYKTLIDKLEISDKIKNIIIQKVELADKGK